MQKIPYMLVIGDQEWADETVNVRKYREAESETYPLTDFVSLAMQFNQPYRNIISGVMACPRIKRVSAGAPNSMLWLAFEVPFNAGDSSL